MSSMSFQEKSAWGTLFCQLIVGTLYFSSTWRLWRADQLEAATILGLSIGFLVLLIIILSGYHIIVAALSRSAGKKDERDRLIAWRSGNVSGNVLGLGIVTVILHIIIAGGTFGDPLWQQPAVIATALMFAVFLSQLVELGTTIWYHRRGL